MGNQKNKRKKKNVGRKPTSKSHKLGRQADVHIKYPLLFCSSLAKRTSSYFITLNNRQ